MRLKDYYGMVKVLEDFPEIHQTFNLVPSMLVQIEEYAAGTAADPFLRAALKPAEELTEHEQEFILQYFFQANPSRMIYRYPRYGELYDHGKLRERSRRVRGARSNRQAFRDLQVLSQLAWFDEEFLEKDPDIAGLVRKGPRFQPRRSADARPQADRGRGQGAFPFIASSQARGQIEDLDHAVLPSDPAADLRHANRRSRAPVRPAAEPVSLSRTTPGINSRLRRKYMDDRIGLHPAGLWPSEGSVSDEVAASRRGSGVSSGSQPTTACSAGRCNGIRSRR